MGSRHNESQPKNTQRPGAPKSVRPIRDPIKRFLFVFSWGVAMGLMLLWALNVANLQRATDSRHWRTALLSSMLELANPAEWFWMLVGFGFLMAVFTEVYYHYFNVAIDE